MVSEQDLQETKADNIPARTDGRGAPIPNQAAIDKWMPMGEGESVFFKGVATGRLPQMLPHP